MVSFPKEPAFAQQFWDPMTQRSNPQPTDGVNLPAPSPLDARVCGFVVTLSMAKDVVDCEPVIGYSLHRGMEKIPPKTART